jgi:hypothetical protein
MSYCRCHKISQIIFKNALIISAPASGSVFSPIRNSTAEFLKKICKIFFMTTLARFSSLLYANYIFLALNVAVFQGPKWGLS